VTDKPKRKRRNAPPKTPAEQITRGLSAQREWSETEDAFLDVRENLLEAIAETGLADTEARERIYGAIWSLGRVRDLLIARINDGQFAEASEKAMRELIDGQPLN